MLLAAAAAAFKFSLSPYLLGLPGPVKQQRTPSWGQPSRGQRQWLNCGFHGGNTLSVALREEVGSVFDVQPSGATEALRPAQLLREDHPILRPVHDG